MIQETKHYANCLEGCKCQLDELIHLGACKSLLRARNGAWGFKPRKYYWHSSSYSKVGGKTVLVVKYGGLKSPSMCLFLLSLAHTHILRRKTIPWMKSYWWGWIMDELCLCWGEPSIELAVPGRKAWEIGFAQIVEMCLCVRKESCVKRLKNVRNTKAFFSKERKHLLMIRTHSLENVATHWLALYK